MKGTIVDITSRVFPGCGWVTCPEGRSGRTRRWAAGEFFPASSLLPLKPTPWIAWMTFPLIQMRLLYLKERACFSGSLFMLWTCPDTVVNHNGQKDGSKTKPQTKSCYRILKGILGTSSMPRYFYQFILLWSKAVSLMCPDLLSSQKILGPKYGWGCHR